MANTGKLANRIAEAMKGHSRSVEKFIDYGTAGFRTQAHLLDHVLFRTGIVSSLRSKVKKASIGVMITASHNPEEDNGAKVVDPLGEMLEPVWERIATEIANLPDEKLADAVLSLIAKENIDLSVKSSVVLGQDTRKSSPALSESFKEGANVIEDTEILDFGIVSTPILHYLVVCTNDGGVYGHPTAEGYQDKLAKAFKTIVGKEAKNGSYEPSLIIDGANGVGANVCATMLERLGGVLSATLVNVGAPGILNHECGADYVKVNQCGPLNISSDCGKRCASLDGDADRLIYFYFIESDSNNFRMLDGDKIALLFADHFTNLLRKSNLNLKVGMVQTAYANGSSTNYAEQILKIPVTFTPTGVKHLHHEAQKFDVGVYFEANGHGTTVFSEKAVKQIKEAALTGNEGAVEFAAFLDLINSTVGDAISDMLAVEAILCSKGWHIKQWDAMYEDLPNRLRKVSVADRNLIKTTDAERRVVTPEGLQDKIDTFTAKYKNGRSFVRPSGTEDVVRVYAEADTQQNADSLAAEVAAAVTELCSG